MATLRWHLPLRRRDGAQRGKDLISVSSAVWYWRDLLAGFEDDVGRNGGCLFSTPHGLAGLPLSLVQELEAQMYLCFFHGVKLWFLGRHWCRKGDLVGSWQKWPVAREIRCRNGRCTIPMTLQMRETPRLLRIHRGL